MPVKTYETRGMSSSDPGEPDVLPERVDATPQVGSLAHVPQPSERERCQSSDHGMTLASHTFVVTSRERP